MGDHPVIGYLVWAVLIGAVFAWEGLSLSHISADAQRDLSRDHALSTRKVGTLRALAMAGLASLRPRLAFPAPGMTSVPCLSRNDG